MSKLLWKCAVVGGVIVFAWGMISWMVLPMHHSSLKKFKDESDVAEVIQKNAETSGMYVLPNTFAYSERTSRSEMEQGLKMMEEGPFVLASVRKEGVGKMGVGHFISHLITQIIGALIVTWMLLQTKGLKFKKQVLFVTLFGVGAGLLTQLPDWNWWGFSSAFVVANLFDLIVGWFLAGLAIAKLNKAK